MEDLIQTLGDPGGVLAKGLVTALVVASLAWIAVRSAVKYVPQVWQKWSLSIAAAIGMVLLAHGAELVSYGPGAQGWSRAIFFGLLAGCLAPTVAHRVVKRFMPGLHKGGNDANPDA